MGMGIGAFAQGLASGYGIGSDMRERGEREALKSDLAAAQKEATDKYGPELGDEGYSYMFKKMAATMIGAGNVDGAKKLLEWGSEAETKANTKQFATGLRQADMGDLEGFDKTLKKLGSAKGYGPQVDIGFARDSDGKIIANKDANGETFYRMSITPPGADKPVIQDVRASSLKETYARWFNPQAAFEAEQSAKTANAKRDADIVDYGRKRNIDAEYERPERAQKERDKGQKERVDAIDALRKRDIGGKSFDDLGEAEREDAVQKELTLRRGSASAAGATAPTGPKVVMDRATGQPVKPGGSAPSAGTTPGSNQPTPRFSSAAPGPLGLNQSPQAVAGRSAVGIERANATIGALQQMEQQGGLTDEENARLDRADAQRRDLVEQRNAAARMYDAPGLPAATAPSQQQRPETMSREEYLRRRAEASTQPQAQPRRVY